MTTGNLVALDPEPIAPGLITMVEELVADVESGRVSSIAFALVYRDGSVGQRWSEAPNVATLLGSIARLTHKLNLSKDAEA